jgi:hypothetical protein
MGFLYGKRGRGNQNVKAPEVLTPEISIALSSTSLAVQQSSFVEFNVTLTRTNFEGTVTLGVSGQAANVSVTYPNGQTFTGGTTTRTIRLTAASNATLGADEFTVSASGSGVETVLRSATLTVSAPSPVIVLSLSPSAGSLVQGGTVDITASVARTNYTGEVGLSVTGLPTGVSESYPNTSLLPNGTPSRIIRLTATGAAPLVTADSYTVTASGAGVSNSVANATVSVTSGSSDFPNEPAGMTPYWVTDGTINSGSGVSWNWFEPESGWNVQVADAPYSPDRVLRFGFPNAVVNGRGGGTVYFTLPTNTRRIYVSARVRWSANWKFHQGGAKWLFLQQYSGPNRILAYSAVGNATTGPGGRFGFFGTDPEPSTPHFVRDAWHHIEVVIVCNTANQSDGSYQLWVDGVQMRNISGVQFWSNGDSTFNEMQYDSTQGGGPDTLNAQHYDTDHLVIKTSTSRT